ncbi:MAG TPA: mechanosensitive ion channel family protein [Thermohalobaculum sp.]|nr:mechanosensitive ion channel family protein [Thermohalobaculum sp.]
MRTGLKLLHLVPVLLVLALLSAGGPAAAQLPDYGKLFGTTTDEPSDAATPRQSRPADGADPAAALSAADYARVAEAAPDPMLGAAHKAISLFRERLVGLLRRAPGSFEEIGTTLAAASPTGRSGFFLGVVVFAGLLLTVGAAINEFFVQFIARPAFIRLQAAPAVGYAGKLPVLTYRVLLTAAGIVITILTGAAVGLFFYEEHAATQLTVITVFAVYAAVMLSDTVWRMVLAPFLPHYRLPSIGDAPARRLYRWLTYTTGFAIVTSAFSYWMLELGLPREVYVLVTLLLTLATVLLLLMTMRSESATVTGIILSGQAGRAPSWLQRAGAALWAPTFGLYLVGTWADLAFRLIMGIEAGPSRLLAPYLTLIAGLCVYAAAIYVIERVFERQRRMRELNERAAGAASPDAAAAVPVAPGEGIDDEGGASERVIIAAAPAPRRGGGLRTLDELARRVAALFALGAAGYALAAFWAGPGVFSGNPMVEMAAGLAQIAFVGYVVFHAARIWLDRKIEDEGGDIELNPGDEGGAAGATRLATLLPLVRNFILIVILTALVLIVAMRMGANVAPLFAGAGIVGLAIGFGSQALVRDILSGAFFLLDDAFRKGEYIDVGSVKGTVEKISLRSFQLRHHLGMLHTIPFGEIQHLTNFSRDWVMMKLPLRLTYDTDVERVRKLIKKLGVSLMDDPEIGDKFMQPLKSQGVIQMDESAMIVRVKFMTRPGDQWVIRKRVFAEIRELFEREGINFAHREVTVRIPGLPKDGELDETQQRAVGAAARRALDVVEAETLRPTGTGGGTDDR